MPSSGKPLNPSAGSGRRGLSGMVNLHRRVPPPSSTRPCTILADQIPGVTPGGIMAESRDEIGKLRELIKDIQIAMMTTRRADGQLVSRPMSVQEKTAPGAD